MNSPGTAFMAHVCLSFLLIMKSSLHYVDCNHLVNWYRLRDVNYEDELSILDRKITVPVLLFRLSETLHCLPQWEGQ
jgi:hypothetical protein